MSSPEVIAILQELSGKLTPDNAPVTLSAILKVFCRHRFQPPDPEYISEKACYDLLELHPGLYSLLEKSVAEEDDSTLWACGILAFRGVDLRTRRPVTEAEVIAERELEELLNTQRASISAFANARSPLEWWDAPFSDRPFSDFLSSLRLLNSGREFPCLLLHGLGNPIDPDTSDALRRLFSPGQHCLYINAFGTGKTRMIFEGLCRRWGFYIPCSWSRDRLGSFDMQRCLQMDNSIAYSFQKYPPWDDDDVARNDEAAQVAFSRVFLSRLAIFKIFLDELDDKKSPDAQMRWLLFQTLTQRLEPYDIFDKVTTAVSRVSEFYMKDMIADLLLDVKARLDGSETELFCIVDN